jgi:MIP family channel proteins
MDSSVKAYIAELLGTFTLVFIGGLSVVVVTTPEFSGNANVVIPALAHGLALVVLAFVYGGISGTHVNPAITLSLLLGGKIEAVKGIVYIVMQVIGAILAALVIETLLPQGNAGQATGGITASNLTGAGVLEFLFTFLLATTVWQTAAHGRAGNLAPIAIGLTLTVCILAGGVISGASLNPARTLGPAIIGGDLSYAPVYIIAQLLGGVAAWVVNAMVLTPDKK